MSFKLHPTHDLGKLEEQRVHSRPPMLMTSGLSRNSGTNLVQGQVQVVQSPTFATSPTAGMSPPPMFQGPSSGNSVTLVQQQQQHRSSTSSLRSSQYIPSPAMITTASEWQPVIKQQQQQQQVVTVQSPTSVTSPINLVQHVQQPVQYVEQRSVQPVQMVEVVEVVQPQPQPVQIIEVVEQPNYYRQPSPPPQQDEVRERIIETEKIVEVPFEKVVYEEREVQVPVFKEVIKEVPVDKIVEVPVEKIVYQDREATVKTVEKVVYQDKVVEVPIDKVIEVPVEKIIEVPVEKIVYQDKVVTNTQERERIVEVPVEKVVYQTSEVEVPVEKIVYQDRTVEVERIVYKEIEIPVERVVDRVVHLPAPAQTMAPSPARVIEVVKSGEGVIRESTEPLIYRDGIPRESLNMSQPIAQRTVEETTVGLGIRITQDFDRGGLYYVEEIIPGYAASRSGQVLVDDEVVSIDGRPIPEIGMIKTMTVARVGTTSTVTFRRGGRNETFNVSMTRCFPGDWDANSRVASIGSISSMQGSFARAEVRSTGRYAAGEESMAYATEAFNESKHEVRVSGNRVSMSTNQDQEILRAIAEGKSGSRSSALGYASATDGLVSNYEYDRVGESRRESNGWRSSVRDQTGYDARGAAPEQDYI